MENASKALLIAGAILLCILIIAIGMFIYNSAQNTITNSLTNLSTQEIEAFNNQFLIYDGWQTGSNIKSLMGKLIANANTFVEEPAKIPVVRITKVNESDSNFTLLAKNVAKVDLKEWPLDEYVAVCGAIRNKIDLKHEYYIKMSYQKNGLIDVMHILYDQSDVDLYDNVTEIHRKDL